MNFCRLWGRTHSVLKSRLVRTRQPQDKNSLVWDACQDEITLTLVGVPLGQSSAGYTVRLTLSRKCAAINRKATPSSNPVTTNFRPCPTTKPRMLNVRAPSAMRSPPDRESACSEGAVTDASVWPPDGHSVLRPPPRSSVGDVVPWELISQRYHCATKSILSKSFFAIHLLH